MEKKAFRELVQKKIVILDGATGSNLQKSGMPVGICPEQWIIENSQIMKQLQIDYIKAGTDILYAPTFTCNRIKLEEYGLQDQLVKMNHRLVEISKEAVAECGCQEKVFIAGDLTMTGQQLYPVGKLQFEELVEIYKEQAGVLVEAGVDLFVVETMMSLQECRAAVLAIKEICNLPIMVTLTFNEDERTLFGTDAKTAVVVLQSLGADAVGLNCSTGPDKMHQIVEDMRSVANIPLIAKPNAGLPELKDGETVFDMEPQEFAEEMEKLVEKGISIVGGCCGTTPKHISRMRELVEKKAIPQISKEKVRAITTERKTVEIDINGRFMVVGERINPTGKKALQAELREGKLDIVTTFVEEQVELGADILDVNVGMNGIDEKQTMLDVINHVTMISNIPLSIDSSSIEVLEAALRIYPGRALINSISLESEKFEKLIPIAKKYGAMFILLPLSDEGLPKDIQEKKDIIGKILDRAYSFGMTKEDVVVDGLVNTIGANKRASVECMETIQYCKQELGVATICGLSNISFGLPERQFVNSTFLAFAIKEGLTMAIANPSQDLLMNVAVASDLLMNREEADIRYIDRVSKRKFTMTAVETKNGSSEKEQMHPVFEAVVKGNRKGIVEIVKKAIEEGFKPNALIDDILIPAINHVGKLFDEMIYFLPQLISSAEAMETAIDYLEPLLEKKKNEGEEVTIVFATVEGDIHDIGKNLVVLMLKNYGYRVIDLGKDVPSDTIIETAKKEHAKIIGLSALMTTTMMQMKEVVDKVKAQNLDIKVIIGGAVITQSFADEIGADGYSKDAQEAVGLVKNLL
ncbi:MAG: dihydropteroate synthase [Clostridiales bacterium]|nr:dihydropteroate synthase [Clostridiales bacterium]